MEASHTVKILDVIGLIGGLIVWGMVVCCIVIYSILVINILTY